MALASVVASALWLVLQDVQPSSDPIPQPAPPRPLRAGVTLPAGHPRRIYLIHGKLPAVPIRPLAEVLNTGVVRLLRAAPPPERPSGPADWSAAGVVLPRERLDDLAPVQRAALRSILLRWSEPVELGVDRFRGLGVRFGEAELRGWLHWLR